MCFFIIFTCTNVYALINDFFKKYFKPFNHLNTFSFNSVIPGTNYIKKFFYSIFFNQNWKTEISYWEIYSYDAVKRSIQ